MKNKQSMIVFFGIALTLLTVGTASSAEIHVYSGDLIQTAVNSANPSDTIIVHPGTYVENVDVNKELTIESFSGNPDDTIVQAEFSNDHVFYVNADNITIKGFNVSGANDFYRAGIWLEWVQNANIKDNKLSNNHEGIRLDYSSNSTLTSNNASNCNYGIWLTYSDENTLTSNNASNNENGIVLSSSSNNMLTSNTASNSDAYDIHLNGFGIRLNDRSKDNTLTYNTMTDNRYNFGAGDRFWAGEINNIDTSNTVDGKPIYYLVNLSDITLDSTSNAGTVYCINCQDLFIKDLNLENNGCGIYLYNTTGSNIDNNTISDNNHGIWMDYSSGNTLTSNNISDNLQYGIGLSFSSGNTLTSNNASYTSQGTDIELMDSKDNMLTDNTASNSNYGISLWHSSNNTLRNNIMTDNWINSNFRDGEINNIDTSNTVDGKPIYYLVNLSDITLDSTSNAGTVYCINCQDISIKDLNLENNGYGIYLYNTTGSNIGNNTVSSNGDGIWLDYSSGNTLTSNNASNSMGYGFGLNSSSDNILTSNTEMYNMPSGIYLGSSSDNLIYNNHFWYLEDSVFGADNTWNSTTKMVYRYNGKNYESYIGNFYVHYTGSDVDGNGIGDIPYYSYSSGSIVDNYPLMVFALIVPSHIDIENLKEHINGPEVDADASTKHALNVKLDEVIDKLYKEGNDKAIKKLEDFIKLVDEMVAEERLNPAQAEYLKNEANRIIGLIQNSEG